VPKDYNDNKISINYHFLEENDIHQKTLSKEILYSSLTKLNNEKEYNNIKDTFFQPY